MTLKVECDDCGKLEEAYEPSYDGARRPHGWQQVAKSVGKYTYWDDYCATCYPKHKPAEEDDESSDA